MKGDSIVVEEHHIKAAQGAVKIMLPEITRNKGKYTISVAGESGSGKSEIATAIANEFKTKGPRKQMTPSEEKIYPGLGRKRSSSTSWTSISGISSMVRTAL
jgi:ABC-type dipeptide/oligopeptide/nickel transport system ATPase component